MRTKHIKFSRAIPNGFSKELRKRMNSYFKEKNIARYGNWQVHLKSIIWLLLYLLPFVLILVVALPAILKLLLVFLMGVAKCGIGLNTMHDANHGTFSKKRWVNKLASAS